MAGLDRHFVAEEIGIELSPTRLKCGLLSLKVVQGALLGTDEWPSGTPDEDPTPPRSPACGMRSERHDPSPAS